MVRWAAVVVLAAFAALALANLAARSPQRERDAQRHFSADQIARGRRLSLERRALFWGGTLLELGLLLWLALSGMAPRLGALADGWTGHRWMLSVLCVGAICFLAQEALGFPLRLSSGLCLQRAWGLTNRSFASWMGDYAKGLGVSAVIGTVLLVLLFLALRVLPRTWWLAATAGSVVLGVFFAFVFPVLVAPLFNRIVPLAQTSHAALLPRIETMAREAGLPVRDVLVMDASRQGRHTNAYFAGFGPTRRIVLYDTLLDSHPPDEVLSILAHEMGHWRHHHIAKGIALGTAGALVAFFVLSRLLMWAAALGIAGFWQPHEPAAIPLILLLAFVGSFLVMPIQNWVSRAFERQADQAALELGGSPEIFAEAEKRLVRNNISDPAPSDLSVFLFATHPTPVDRVETAMEAQAHSRRGGAGQP
jgi:STE24 endopeptidase